MTGRCDSSRLAPQGSAKAGLAEPGGRSRCLVTVVRAGSAARRESRVPGGHERSRQVCQACTSPYLHIDDLDRRRNPTAGSNPSASTGAALLRPDVGQARFCRRSAQLICTEPHGPASSRTTDSPGPLLSSADPAQMNESGRIWMAATRLKTARSAVRSRPRPPGTPSSAAKRMLPAGCARPGPSSCCGAANAGREGSRSAHPWSSRRDPSMPTSLARSCGSSTVRSS